MLNRIQGSDFGLVTELLDTYIQQKQTNSLLWAWKNLKNNTAKTRRLFSHSSFSKPPTQATYLPRPQPYENYEKKRLSYCRTVGNGLDTDRKKVQLKNSFPITENQQDDDDFEDIVLQKIKAIQSRLNEVKSQASSSVNDSRSSTRRLKTDYTGRSVQGIKFELNPRYIPMRQRMNGVQSFIMESQNYQVDANSSLDFDNGMETPRIGSKNQTINLRSNIIRQELNSSVLSAGQANYETRDSRTKPYYQLLESTGNNSFLREVSSELNSQSNSRVYPQIPLTSVPTKNAQENIPILKQEQMIGYHPDVGYFRMVPISESEVNPSAVITNVKNPVQFPKRPHIRKI